MQVSIFAIVCWSIGMIAAGMLLETALLWWMERRIMNRHGGKLSVAMGLLDEVARDGGAS